MSITITSGSKLNTLAVDTNLMSGSNKVSRKIGGNSNVEFGDYAVERTLYLQPLRSTVIDMTVRGIIVTTDSPITITYGNTEIQVEKLFVHYGTTYGVRLTNNSATAIATVGIAYAADPALPPLASFSAYGTVGVAPLTVSFTDRSTQGPMSWTWNFGDGTTSTEKNPVHVYDTVGTFVVSLTVSNGAGTSTTATSIQAQAGEFPTWSSRTWSPSSAFNSYVDGGVAIFDGGAVSVGSSDNNNETCLNVIRYDGRGTVLWHTVVGDLNSNNNLYGEFAVIDTLNTVVVFTTYFNPAPQYNGMSTLAVIVLTRDTGDIIWQYGIEAQGDSIAQVAVVQAISVSDGLVIMTSTADTMVTLVKMDMGGNIVWSPTFNCPDGVFTYGGGVVADSDENLYMLAITGGTNAFVTKRDRTTGDSLWCIELTGFGFNTDFGCITCRGTSDLFMMIGNVLFRMTRDGTVVFAKAIDAAGNRPTALALSPDGLQLMITYYLAATDGYVLARLDLNTDASALMYSYELTNSDGSIFSWYYNTYANALEISSSGNEVFVFGTSSNNGGGIVMKLPIDLTSYPLGLITPSNSNQALPITTSTLSDVTSNFSVIAEITFGNGGISISQPITHFPYALVDTYEHSEGRMEAYVPPPVLVPVAAFSSSTNSGITPLTVNFTDTSTNVPTSWAWDFGDGGTDTVQNPTHVYTTPGSYTVTLTATNSAGSNAVIAGMNALIPAPVAGFTLTPSSGVFPLPVSFTDTSTNSPTSWAWDFGDGSSSSLKNPTHTYTTAGTYNVNLNATNSTGSGSHLTTAAVTVAIPAPVASFSLTPASGLTPLTVNFTDTSTNTPTSWAWTFGDGGTSTLQNPSHAYTTAGSYTVSLTATNGTGSDSHTTTSAVTAAIPAPVASFSVSPSSGVYPLVVTFTDTSSNSPTSWAWTFGDGTTSTAQSPQHTYGNVGTYNVSLTATNSTGSNSHTTTSAVTVAVPTPEVSFNISPSSGIVPFTVNFTDTTINSPTSWAWTFGDGATSTLKNPSHSYTTPGTYNVTLNATNSTGTGTHTTTSAVIASIPAPVASFNISPSSGTTPLTVNFTDTSTNSPTSWLWGLGDGATSTAQNPSHTYNTPGFYNIVLNATNSTGTGIRTVTSGVTAAIPAPVASFTLTPSSGTNPLTVNFTDTSTNTPTSWAWTFGDGGTSTLKNPSHNYTAAGTYNVSLTATNSTGSDSHTATSAVAVSVPAPVASFTLTPTSGDAPLTVNFTDTSTNTPTSWAWTFGDGGTSTLKNPSHVYTATGTYDVALTATNSTGSSSHTTTSAVTATLQAPVASFTQSATSGLAPLTVNFTDTSTNSPTYWHWDFGDGSTSLLQNPSHTYTYSSPGPHDVTLSAYNATGFTTHTVTAAVTITEITPVASFTYSPSSGLSPLTVNFTDTSTNNPWLWTWVFGDGTTSGIQNPSHTYTSAGTYGVSLVATNGAGYNSHYDATAITVVGVPVASFTGAPTSGSIPFTVTFTDTTTNSPTSWAWTFGDGGTSTSQNPSHVYTSVGTYDVSLVATNAAGTSSYTRTAMVVTSSTASVPVAAFTGTPTTGTTPMAVTFTDTSNNSPTSWLWDFGDGGTSTSQNPTYVYNYAGTYNVTLTATNSAGTNAHTSTGYVTANAAYGSNYQVPASLRLRSTASANLTRTMATPTNNTLWTWSGWVKRGTLGTTQVIMAGKSPDNFSADTLYFDSTDALGFSHYTNGSSVAPTVIRLSAAVFRDTSSWYHIVLTYNSSSTDPLTRVRIMVNGSELLNWTTNNTLAINAPSCINSATVHTMGSSISGTQYFDGNLAEVTFVDGQARLQDSFGADIYSVGAWGATSYLAGYVAPLGVWPTGSADPYWSYVTLLQDGHTDLTGINTFTGGNTPTTAGPFVGMTALDCTSANTPYQIPTSSTTNFVAGSDFTLEFWVYPISSIYYEYLLSWGDHEHIASAGGNISWVVPYAGSYTSYLNVSVPLNQWSHVAFVRAISVSVTHVQAFANGVLVNTSMSGNTDWDGGWGSASVNATHPLVIGGGALSGGFNFSGKLAGLRVTKGLARYHDASFSRYGVNLFGNNGFYLPYSDTSSVAALGHDASVGGNHWTPSNVSIAAGLTCDALQDAPLGAGGALGNGLGNYATLSPLNTQAGFNQTLSNGNLTVTAASNLYAASTIVVTTGKWYFEVTVQAVGATLYIMASRATGQFGYMSTGQKYVDGTASAYGASYTAGDVIGVVIDITNNLIEFFKNGTTQGSTSYTFGGASTPYVTSLTAGTVTMTMNFGQHAFTYARPSGSMAVHTGNLVVPDATMIAPAQSFDAVPYVGWNQNLPSAEFDPTSGGDDPYADSDVIIIQMNGDFTSADTYGTVVTVVGSPSINTSIKKWGTGSGFFNQSTLQYLRVENNSGCLFPIDSGGNGPFTFEFWVYPVSTQSVNRIYQNAASGDQITYNASRMLTATFGGHAFVSTVALTASAWNHVSLSRYSDGTCWLLINGMIRDSAPLNVDVGSDTGYSYWGGIPGGLGSNFGGYLDDIRVTQGFARYPISNDISMPSSDDVAIAWIRSLSTADHKIVDSARGVGLGTTYSLSPNLNAAEAFEPSGVSEMFYGTVSVQSDPSYNTEGQNYILWAWIAGAAKGVAVVTHTGTGAANAVAHTLGAKPAFIITKSRTLAHDWQVYHTSLGATQALWLNQTTAAGTSATYWNNTEPTTTTFTVGTANSTSGENLVSYVFAPIVGFSAFGSYVGNANAVGPFVYCGFKPRLIIIKSVSTGSWSMWDTARDTHDVMSNRIYANSNAAPSVAGSIDVLANGFKLRTAADPNAAQTYIYAAFAESSFKYSLAG